MALNICGKTQGPIYLFQLGSVASFSWTELHSRPFSSSAGGQFSVLWQEDVNTTKSDSWLRSEEVCSANSRLGEGHSEGPPEAHQAVFWGMGHFFPVSCWDMRTYAGRPGTIERWMSVQSWETS